MSKTVLKKAGTDVRSGIQTAFDPENEPRGFRVTWIDWDSDFRRNLQLNDVIVGVNDRSLAALVKPGEYRKAVGQTQEGLCWQEIGVSAHQEIALQVLRNNKSTDVTGKLDTDYFYFDADGREALAPGGPAKLTNDGLGAAWSRWLEDFVKRTSHNLTEGWTYRGFASRDELAWYLEQKPRIDLLLSKYPGAFADTVHGDWQKAMELTRGKKADLGEKELEYRAIGEKRVQIAKTDAARAWTAMREELAGETIPAFPVASPLERQKAVGKIVELPPTTPRNFLNDLGTSFIAAGSPSDGYYFILATRKPFRDYYEVLRRYTGQVNPTIIERVRFLARILDEPQMFTVNARPAMGLVVEPLAALAGDDEMFTDLRTSPAKFAAEETLSSLLAAPRDDTSPRNVIEAMIFAVKTGDEKTWVSLFANWRVVGGPGGRTMIDPSYVPGPSYYSSYWERSRRLIMKEVYDTRVDYVEEPRRVLAGNETNGLPNVDQVMVWVDHYGFFDGEYRTFQNINVNRRWLLQRLNEGPWKIVSAQSL